MIIPALDPHADPRCARFTLRTDCPRCGAHLPINGPAPQADCAECGHRLEVPDTLFQLLLQMVEEAWPNPRRAGRMISGDLTYRWTIEPLAAAPCPRCEAPLPAEPVEEAVQCGTCNHTCSCVALHEGQRHGVDTARWLYDGHTELTRPRAAPRPVAMACPQCGGGLTVGTDRARLAPCDYCGTTIHLPDAIWRQLHPPREVHPWTVRFEGPSVPAQEAAAARVRAEHAAKRRHEEAAVRAQRQAREAEELARDEQQRRADQSERDKALHRHQVRARRAMLGAWAVSLLAAVVIAPYLVAYTLGVFSDTPRPAWTWVPMVAGGTALAVAWPASVAAGAWRGRVPVLGSLLHSAFQLFVLAIPVVGVGAAIWLAARYASGSQPTPIGEQWRTHRHPRGAGWPVVVLVVLAAPFFTATISILTDTPLIGMLRWFAED